MMLPLVDLPNAVYPIVGGKLDGFMFSYERNVLIALLTWRQPKVVIEIGVQRGRCARLLLDHVSSIESYIGVDALPGHTTALSVQQDQIPEKAGELVLDDIRFELVLRPNGSHDLRPGDLPFCDVMLIDGDHSFAGVRHDSDLATATVCSGGLILWHDYTPLFQNDVASALHALYAEGRDIRHIPDTWLAMEKR